MADWKSLIALAGFGVSASLLMTANPFSLAIYPFGLVQQAIEPLSESEAGEIDFLNCLEESASGLDDGTVVDVQVSDQVFDGGSVSYLSQRLDEILYPRLRINEQLSEYVMEVRHETEVAGGPIGPGVTQEAPVIQFRCSNVIIELKEVN